MTRKYPAHTFTFIEGYGDKWAIPAPADIYPTTGDLFSKFQAFMRHGNVTLAPDIQMGLFS